MNQKFPGSIAIMLGLLLVMPFAMAQTGASDTGAAQPDSRISTELQPDQAIRRLLAIKESLEDKRERVRNLVVQLAQSSEEDKPRIGEQIARLRETIAELSESFESIAVSGANLRDLDAADDKQLTWRDELMQIARPILSSLKQATEKPRRIEELRRSISLQQQQLEVTRRAIASIAQFEQYEIPPTVASGLGVVAAAWRERSRDIESALSISRDELQNLEAGKVAIFDTIWQVAREFMFGRGLTLLLALVTAIVVWTTMRALRRLVRTWRRAAPKSEHAAKIRLLLYAYHLLTILLMTLSVLSVFYLRGDLLLLSLTMIALIMLALGIWRFLPGYIQEARLLLNVGAAREGERVIYQGLPFRITSLNLQSELRNPDLEGVIRLPLSAMAKLTSRPRTDEAWFPCRSGDFLLLPDGGFGQVIEQTVELVRLRVVGSIVQFSSTDFLHLNARNLSREGFGVAVVFGIDYQHQPISLDRIPAGFASGLKQAFETSAYGPDLKDLLVEFKAASSSSLDYLIYATMGGESAAGYFKIGRLIQQSCVEICNQEGWVIPFTQVTFHQAEPTIGKP